MQREPFSWKLSSGSWLFNADGLHKDAILSMRGHGYIAGSAVLSGEWPR